jgi:ATPase subunit of ABC transporter with duplicated ATPase domains
VSHDRYFLDSVVNRVLHIDRGSVSGYNGNYSYFRERSAPITPTQTLKSREPIGKQSYLDFKEQSKKKTRHKREIVSTRSKIADFEKELEKLEADIARTIPRHDWEALQRASSRKSEVENALIELMAQLEGLEGGESD